jgi:hypothetical protein
MKKLFALAVLSAFVTFNTANAQAARKSPKMTASNTISSGATITIEYSAPSLNGRTIGKDVEPKDGTVWRMGANEATTFEVDRDVTIDGQKLAAGKYSLFGIGNGDSFKLMLNSAHKIWGTQYEANKDKDVLKFDVKKTTTETVAEKLVYTIGEDGKVSLHWGTMMLSFWVK